MSVQATLCVKGQSVALLKVNKSNKMQSTLESFLRVNNEEKPDITLDFNKSILELTIHNNNVDAHFMLRGNTVIPVYEINNFPNLWKPKA